MYNYVHMYVRTGPRWRGLALRQCNSSYVIVITWTSGIFPASVCFLVVDNKYADDYCSSVYTKQAI